jgi:hypothetical protein
MTPALGLVERRCERLNECVEPVEEALHQFRRDLGLSQHLFESKLVSPFHDRPLTRETPSWKPMMQEGLGEFNPARQ